MADEWLYTEDDLANTVSIKRGMNRVVEERCRREGVTVIMKVGSGDHGLKLKANPTLATAAIFFHRFYMFHPFQEYPREITALACIFLAGKVEETPKKCRDICRIAEQKFPDYYSHRHNTLIEEVMGVERVLLQVLRFDLQIEQPYKFIISYIQEHQIDKEQSRQFVQRAWAFTNDNFYTSLCLLWEPEIIAIAMLHMSFNMGKSENERAYVPNPEWWNGYVSNLSSDLIDKICHKVLDFYAITREPAEIERQREANNAQQRQLQQQQHRQHPSTSR